MTNLSTLFLLFTLTSFQPKQTQQAKAKGAIVGVITNEHADPIINALVYLKKEQELIKVTTTDTLGNYQFLDLKPNTYSINVSYVGYYKKNINDLEVDKGKKKLDITMRELRCTHGH